MILRHRFLLLAFSVGVAVTAASSAPTDFKIEEATITSIQQAILDKKTTSTDVVKSYLARIKAYNGPGVKEPNGILGVIETVPHSGSLNALATLAKK
jgi:amidase